MSKRTKEATPSPVNFDPNVRLATKRGRVVLGLGIRRAEFFAEIGGNVPGFDAIESIVEEAWEAIPDEEDCENYRDVTFKAPDGSTATYEGMDLNDFKGKVILVEIVGFTPIRGA